MYISSDLQNVVPRIFLVLVDNILNLTQQTILLSTVMYVKLEGINKWQGDTSELMPEIQVTNPSVNLTFI